MNDGAPLRMTQLRTKLEMEKLMNAVDVQHFSNFRVYMHHAL